MRIVTISDTHNKHELLSEGDLLFPGEMIIHAGDISGRGSKKEVTSFINWFSSLPYKYKILIAGNHDWGFEKTTRGIYEQMCKDNNIIYLNDSGAEIEGIKIWGSPISPAFNNWAFNRFRGAHIEEHWKKIPSDTELLITHGPPEGILDSVLFPHPPYWNPHVGCRELLTHLHRLDVKMHIFGHIHEARGVEVKDLGEGPITFVNASTLDARYQPYQEKAYCFNWELAKEGLSEGQDFF